MPLFWLSLAFLSGVILESLLGWPGSSWGWGAIFAIILLAMGFWLPWFVRRLPVFNPPTFLSKIQFPLKPAILIPLMAGAVSLGGWRYYQVQPQITPNDIAYYNDQDRDFVVEGVLINPPDQRDASIALRLRVEQIHAAGEKLFRPVRGLVLAWVLPGGKWQYGDRVRMQGQLQTPFETEAFSYKNYLRRQGIYSTMSNARVELVQHNQGNWLMRRVYQLKDRALGVVYQLFPDPEASLLAGILLGVDTGIPGQVQQAFNDTGTSHIIAISGFNISILSGVLMLGLGRLLGRRWGAIAAAVGIAGYTVLVGAGASVVRAAFMGGLSLFARQVGRRQDGLNSLAMVAAVMAFFNPEILWDVSFQLTFLATLGLVLYADPLIQMLERNLGTYIPQAALQRISGPLGDYFLLTIAAQITTLPVMVYYFKRLSLVSFLTNTLILPAQPPVEILGGLAVVGGLVYQPLGKLLALTAWPFVVYTIRMVELLADVPGAVLVLGPVSLGLVYLYYAVLFGWTFAGTAIASVVWRLQSASAVRIWERRLIPILGSLILLLSVLTVLVWRAALSGPDGVMHIILLDSGNGGGILVQTPAGRSVLINGGSSTTRLSDSLGRRLPLTSRELDFLVVASTRDDQIAALAGNLERFRPDNVLWACPAAKNPGTRALRLNLTNLEVPVLNAQVGEVLDLGSGANLRVVAMDKAGAVLMLDWGEFRMLVPGGLEPATLPDLQNDPELVHVSALLLADSGLAALNPPDWIDKLHPQVVLIGVAADDKRGLPDPKTLEALQGYPILRTDRNGWVEVSTDGKQMWVEAEQP